MSDQESQVVVPFTYDELLGKYDNFFMRNRLKKYFYTRDLFEFQSPLKTDIYFFGRNDLIHSIVSRHKSRENGGLFGLRKTGKTSVVFGIERALEKIDSKYVFIDCQFPAFHMRRWNKALHYIVNLLKEINKLNIPIGSEDKYTEEDAPIYFEKDMAKIFKAFDKKSILLIFDEIENITFNISPTDHWAKGLDFVYFWQTLRSIFQKTNIFSYLIVGTNAMCVEVPMIHGKDNPIFNQVPFTYIPNFDVPQTRDMVRKLGRLMGLKFDEIIYGKLTEDFGGHPFLIRHVCSVINSLCSLDRPVIVGKSLYEQAKQIFNQKHGSYVEMILGVLKEYYSDEYAIMEYLALGDMKTFYDFISLAPYYTNHLLGYGIVEKQNELYHFKIESVKTYLLNTKKYQTANPTQEEMLSEISERRNKIEPQLRLIVRNQLKATFGKAEAKDKVLAIIEERRRQRLAPLAYDELFNPNKSEIYFEDLRKIIFKYWDQFRHIFSADRQDFDKKMQFINQIRADAHAKTVDKDEMQYFRVCISGIEKQVEDFLS